MRKLLFASLAFVALSSAPALAYTWNGFHWGVHAGGAWGKNTATDINGYNGAPGHNWNYNSNGPIIGGQVGFNFMGPPLPPSWLVGIELAAGYMGLSGSGADPLSPSSDTVAKTKTDFYATLLGRVGHFWAAPWMTYVTGGVIGINTNVSVNDNCSAAPCGAGLTSGGNTSFRTGWAVGAGIEYAPSGSLVSYRLEYLYFDVGSTTFTGSLSGAASNWKVKTTGNIVRFAINF